LLKPKHADSLVKDWSKQEFGSGTIENRMAVLHWCAQKVDKQKAKSEYCEKAAIDFMFDDSPVYLESFHDIDTTYLHVIN